MTVELIFELAWKSFVAAGLTLLILQLTKRRSPAERAWIAHAGLVALLFLPATTAAGLTLQVEVLPSVASVAPVELAEVTPPPVGNLSIDIAPAVGPTPGLLDNARQINATQVVPWLYLGPAAVLTLLLVVAVFRLNLLRGRSEVLVEPQWATALAAAQRRMGFKHGTALLVSGELRSPISWGVVRPIILLDRRAAADTEQAEAIIAHELAHVARLDWAMLLLGRLATALYWFNPLVWVLARTCHELSEQAVDDTVLRHDVSNADYAQLLIGTARHNNGAVLLAANGVAGSGTLTHRVERVLNATRLSSPARRSWIVACCAGTFLIAAPLSALTPIRNPGDTRPSPSATQSTKPGPVALVIQSGAQLAVKQDQPAVTGTPSNEGVLTAAIAEHRGKGLAGVPDERISATDKVSLNSLESLETLKSVGALSSSVSRNSLSSPVSPGQPGKWRPRAVRTDAPVNPDVRPLLSAAWYGRFDMVRTLLDAGMDIDATIGRGEGNALMKASRQGNFELVKYLLGRGANINATVPGAGNALLQASYGGHEEIVRHLIARGADVHSINKNESPLGSAVYMGHTNIVKILIAAGAGRENR